MDMKPFKPEKRNGYWILVDSRSGNLASCPTTKGQCIAEADIMNRAFAEAWNETAAMESNS